MWSNFFAAGGFGMYPTLVFGFALVAAAVVYLLRPERRFASLVLSLGLLTFGSGVLGASVGLVNTMRFIEKVPAEEQLKTMAIGVAESLHNVVLALLLAVLSALLASIGVFRASRAAAARSA